jgi:transposase
MEVILMLKYSYTDRERDELRRHRFQYSRRVNVRFEVVLLHSCGSMPYEIAHITGLHVKTIRKYINWYASGGIEKLSTIGQYRPKSQLEKYREQITAAFNEQPPTTSTEAASRIEEMTGVQLSPRAVRDFLRYIGMVFCKVGAIPAKADFDEQERFKKEQLEPEIQRAKAGKSVLLYMDGVHFVHSSFQGYLWCFDRVLYGVRRGESG